MTKALAAGWFATAGLLIAIGSTPASVSAQNTAAPNAAVPIAAPPAATPEAAKNAAAQQNAAVKPATQTDKQNVPPKKVRPVRALAFSPDGKSLVAVYGSAPGSGDLVMWDVETHQPRFTHQETAAILSVAFSPKGDRLAIGTFRSKAILLDAAADDGRRELAGHDSTVRCVAFSPDGRWLATASYDRTVKLWDVASGEVKRTLFGSHSQRWVGFSPDGKWLAAIAPEDGSAKLWSADALGQPPRELKTPGPIGIGNGTNNNVVHAAFSPDSRTLAIADLWGAVLLFDLATGRELERLNNMPVSHWVAFSPDGKWMAAAPAAPGVFLAPRSGLPSAAERREIDAILQEFKDDDASKREAASRRLAAFAPVAMSQIQAALLSPDAEVRDRGRMFAQQIRDGDFDARPAGLQVIPECLAFSPDGKLLACGDWGGAVKLWRVGAWKEATALIREEGGPPAQLVSEYGVSAGLLQATQPPPPFALPAASTATLETLAEFRQDLKNKSWDKAFTRLEKLVEDPSGAVVPAGNGFRLPLRTIVSALLAEMPSAGKNAYRLFYDAEAKTLWDQVQREQGPAEIEKLTRLATVDLATSVGDLAANRLGEILFEQGDMDGAIDAWQCILRHRPDSTLPPVELEVKTATAMVRAGQAQELAEAVQQIKRRYAGEFVIVGGNKVSAAEYVAGLSARQLVAKDERAGADLPERTFARQNAPVWQFTFGNRVAAPQRADFLIQAGGRDVVAVPSAAAIADTAVVGERLYGNFLSCSFALDLETGKLLWSSQRLEDVAQQVQLQMQMRTQMQQGMMSDRTGLAASGGQLWIVATAPQRPLQPGARMAPLAAAPNLLLRRDPLSGQELWNSSQVEALRDWMPIGAPLLTAGNVYVCAHQQNRLTDLHLLALQASDGRLLWSTPIGTYEIDPRRRTAFRPQPTLLPRGTRLYVDSQAGGIAELQAATGAIRWAYTAEPQPQEGGNVSSPAASASALAAFDSKTPFIQGGMLYFKQTMPSALCAIRLNDRTVAWKRTVPFNSVPVGIDKERIYLTGDDVRAYDLKTQKLAWNSPVSNGFGQPLLTEHRYYQFTPRGLVELDKATGEVVRVFPGSDAGSAGGTIVVTPKLLITVSNRAITAYPLGDHAAD